MAGWQLAFGKPDRAVIDQARGQGIVHEAGFAGTGIAADAQDPTYPLFGLLDERLKQRPLRRAATIGGQSQQGATAPARAVLDVEQLPGLNRAVEALQSEAAAVATAR